MALLDQVIEEMKQVKFGKKKAKTSKDFKKTGTNMKTLKEDNLAEGRKLKKITVKKVKFGSGTAKGVKKKMFEMGEIGGTDGVDPQMTPQVDQRLEQLAAQTAGKLMQEAESFLRHVYAMEQEEFGGGTEEQFVRDNIKEHAEFYLDEYEKDLANRLTQMVSEKYRG